MRLNPVAVIIFILFIVTIIDEKFNFLANKLTLGKPSLKLNEFVAPTLLN